MTDAILEQIRVMEGKISERLVNVDPFHIYAAINPRNLEELEPETLMPHILKTNGVITQPLLLWKPPPNHDVWENVKDPYTNERGYVPLEDRDKAFIGIRGHRRLYCILEVHHNPGNYSKVVFDNVKKVKALVFEGSQKEAERLAVDFEEIRGLHKWETLKLVVKRLADDFLPDEICMDMFQLLYAALISNGPNRYDAIVRDCGTDGRQRNAKLMPPLRNHIHNGVAKIFQMGYPVLTDQLVNHYRFVEEKRPVKTDEDKKSLENLVLDLRMLEVQKMAKRFNGYIKDNKDWIPVTKVAIVPDKPKEDKHTSFEVCGKTGYYVAIGGNAEFRKQLILNMKKKNEPEIATNEPSPPKKGDREAVQTSSISAIGKSTAKFLNTGDNKPVEGQWLTEPRSRTEWDQWAGFSEAVQAALLKLTNLDPMVQEVVNALTGVINPEVGASRVEMVFNTLNAYVKESRKPVATTKKK